MCLRTESGRETGLLNLSTSDCPASVRRGARHRLGALPDARERGRRDPVGAVPGVAARARRVRHRPVPGRRHHAAGRASRRIRCLGADAQLPRLAHAIIGRDGRGPTRFLWPAADRRWHRVGVTPCLSDGAGGCEAIVTVQAETIAIELTRRELEVLTMLTSGWSNAEIGSRLWISPRTVGTYVETVLAKLERADPGGGRRPRRRRGHDRAAGGAAAAALPSADGLAAPVEREQRRRRLQPPRPRRRRPTRCRVGQAQVARAVDDRRDAGAVVPGDVADAAEAALHRRAGQLRALGRALVGLRQRRQDGVVGVQAVGLPLELPLDRRRVLAQPRVELRRELQAPRELVLRRRARVVRVEGDAVLDGQARPGRRARRCRAASRG